MTGFDYTHKYDCHPYDHNIGGSRKFCQREPFFDNVFYRLIRGGRMKIPLLADNHRPASETPLSGVSLACR